MDDNIAELDPLETLKFSARVVKRDEGPHQVWGWAYVSEDEQGIQIVDHSGEFIPIAELEKIAAHCVKHNGVSGEMHEGEAYAPMIGSLVTTPEVQKALDPVCAACGSHDVAMKQGWFVGYEIPAERFAKIKAGALLMFSIQGRVKRTELELEVAEPEPTDEGATE